jgi:hypothetical protein
MITRTTAAFFVAAFMLTGCEREVAPSPLYSSALTNSVPTLSHSEVLAKFRARSSPAEIQEFERLAAASDSGSQTHAMETVLFKLTAEELRQIGIGQTEASGHFYWLLATSRGFADDGRAFQQALQSIGVSPGGVMDLGIAGWSVPREQSFMARRALLGAGLHTNEITIVEPRFSLQ